MFCVVLLLLAILLVDPVGSVVNRPKGLVWHSLASLFRVFRGVIVLRLPVFVPMGVLRNRSHLVFV